MGVSEREEGKKKGVRKLIWKNNGRKLPKSGEGSGHPNSKNPKDSN